MLFSGDLEPPPSGAAVVGGAAGERAWAAPHLLNRTGAQRKTILVSDRSDANKAKDNSASCDKPLRIDGFRNGHLGRGTRYRLGEVLWGFFPLAEDEAGTDGEDDVVFLFVNHLSLRRTLPRPRAHTPAMLFASITALPSFSQERGAIGLGSRGERVAHGSC